MRNTNFHILALRSVSILALSLLWPATSMANPEGGVVTGGNANISSAGKVLTVKQNSANAVIDWRKFDIAVDEHTRFQQPSSSATALNRVHNADPSKIMGKLTANGNVMLVNPNGVFFGADSQVDVNGLLATTADISNRDFMNGKLDFNIPGNPNAEVVNVGTITAKEAGLVGLVAPHVANHGVINARLGKVQLASGDTLSVDLYGDGLLEVAVSDAVKTQLVNNTGTINAEGGTIALTAAAGKDIVDSLIAVRGELNAPTVSQHEGKIIIAAEGSNAVINNDASQKGVRSGYSTVVAQAHLDVSGKDAGEQGGSITITADDIAVLAGSVFEASGHSAPTPTHKPSLASATLTANKSVRSEAEFLAHERRAGGSIKIGGDYLGKGTTAAAENVYVSPQSYIINNAVESGDGGRTIIWSDGTTDFRGNVTSLGGKLGGNGGFLETSGKETLVAVGYADLRADKGNKGLYLLDPADVTIYGNQASVFDNAGLVMHLGFDEGAGVNAADSSGNSNNGVLTNGGSFSSDTAPTPQANEYSVLLNNGPDYVHVNDSGTLRPTNVTLSAWVKYNSVNATHVIIGKQEGTGNGNSYGLWFSGGKARGSVTGFSPILDAAQTPSTATWYHYAYTFDDATNTQNLYINGTLAQTGTTNSSIDYNNSPLSLGVEFEQPGGANPQYHLNGLMDDVRIYDNALTATNISELYGNFFTVAGIEKMSTTADVAIQATNSITLDLQGDTLDMANDRNLSLTTTSGDILTASAGKITTNRTGTGGNVTFDAGRDILFNHAIDIEAQNGGDVSFKANRHIVMGAGGTIESLSNPLNTVFWSDADADNEGAIRLVGNTINSLGGDVIMGGGLDDGANSGTASDGRPDNFAQATNVEQKGIFLDATTVQSQAGDILLRGNAAYDVALGEGYYGIRTFNNSVLESTSGDISLIGKTIGKRVIWGMEIRDTTIESQTGDILFDGDAQGTADKVVGVDFFSSDVESTGIGANAGNITLTGNSVGSQDGAGVRFWQQNTYLMTTDGDISITGTSDTGDGVHLARSRLASYGTGANAGNISVTGTGGALGVGIYSFGGIPFQIFNKDGDVTINGTSTATSGDGNYGVALNDYRIYMEGTGSGPDAGTISITGTGGAGVNNNHGVYMFFDKFSYYDLLDNDLIVNGTGGGDGTGTNNHGIYVRTPFDIESTGTGANAGNITFTGTGGTGTTDNYGVKLENGVMKTADSNITITGTGGTGTSNNHGIALINSAELTTTNGDISLTGNAASGTGLYSLTGANVIGDAAMTGDITLSGTSTDLRDIAITSLANITMTATNAMEFTAANINANTLSMTSTAGAITHNSGMLTAPTLNFDAAGIVTANLTSNTVDMGANATGSVLTGLVNGATDQAAADSILGGPGNDPAYTFEGLTIRYAAPAPAGTPGVTRPPVPETPAPETPVLPPVTPTPKPTTPVSPKPNPTPVIATPLTLPNTVVYVSQHPHVGISTTEPGSTNPVKEIGRTTLPASPNAAPESNTDNATDKEEETAVKIKSNKNKLSGLTSGLLRLSPKLAKILGYSKGEVF